MAHSHKYDLENWRDYYDDKVDEKPRLEMMLHLSNCDECLDLYAQCAEASMSPAPLEIKKEVMRRIQVPNNIKQIMFAYIAAACIATGLYSFGWLDKTIDYAPRGMEKSFNAIVTVSENVSKITNNIIWRDLHGKKE